MLSVVQDCIIPTSSTNIPYGANVSQYDAMNMFSRLKTYSTAANNSAFYAHYKNATDATTGRLMDVDNVVMPGGVDLESGSYVQLVTSPKFNISALFQKIAYLKDGGFVNMTAAAGYAQYRQATEILLESVVNTTRKELLKVSFDGSTNIIVLEGWAKNLADKKDWRWETACGVFFCWPVWREYNVCTKCVWEDTPHTITKNGTSPVGV